MVLALGAAGAGAQSGKVVRYNANGAKLGDAIVNAFNAKYPDVSIEMIVAGSGELLARVKSEQEHPRGDVYDGSVETMAAALHLFDSYRTKEIAFHLSRSVRRTSFMEILSRSRSSW